MYEASHAASNTSEQWLHMHNSSENLSAVLQVVPVTIDEYSLQGYYSCPVYTNMQRANVYSPIVSNFTMKTDEPSHKWVLASVAVLLQDELA
jgi:dynein heavy chain